MKTTYSTKFIFKTLQKLEEQNIVPTDFTHSIRQYIYVDPMVPYESNIKYGIGNKFAFEEFIKEEKNGFYISMDCNNFRLINSISHIVGDDAIKSVGKALRDASFKTGFCKLFRSGGDEFLLFTENKSSVNIFIQNAIIELDKIKPINGIYKLTVSFGTGISYLDAEISLKKAKDKKIIEIPHLVSNDL
jgi:GGDEF domain-containing protein